MNTILDISIAIGIFVLTTRLVLNKESETRQESSGKVQSIDIVKLYSANPRIGQEKE